MDTNCLECGRELPEWVLRENGELPENEVCFENRLCDECLEKLDYSVQGTTSLE